MTTPEPRLSDRRSRGPDRSSLSPKKYRKNGSAANGEFGVRTTWSDEMFATPLTACPATRVKSGPLAATGAAAAAGAVLPRACVEGATRCGAADSGADRISARDADAGRRRAVSTRPPAKPATTSTAPTKSLRASDDAEDVNELTPSPTRDARRDPRLWGS